MKLMKNFCEEESTNSPILNYFPRKIDLGVKRLHKFELLKNNTLKERKYTEEKLDIDSKSLYEPVVNKSTKIERKRIFRLVDRIVNIKMNENVEETIQKNILKLRKYCKQLKKVKKDIRKNIKSSKGGDNSPRKQKEKKKK